MSALRVLELGPLDSPHLRKWCEAAAATGAEVIAAGHLRRGARAVELGDACSEVIAIGLPPAPSTRTAERRFGAAARRSAAAVQLLETPAWAVWLRRLIARARPDVVQAHLLDAWGAVAALAGARPLIATAWGSDVYMRAGARRWLAGLAASRADVVTVPEPAMRPRLGGARHVDLGVDLDRFRPLSEEERGAARQLLGLGDGPVVVSFRAPTAVYRLDLAIAGFERLLETHPGARLAVARGPLPLPRRTAERLAPLLAAGSAIHLGAVPHERMPEVLGASDVGVSVPASDGSPRSVWECLACGTPVVLSDLPRIRDRLGSGRGALYAPAEPGAVADALARALDDHGLRKRARSEGRSWVRGEADRRDHQRRLGDLLEELAGGRERDVAAG